MYKIKELTSILLIGKQLFCCSSREGERQQIGGARVYAREVLREVPRGGSFPRILNQ